MTMKAAVNHVLFAWMVVTVSSRLVSAASPEEFILNVTLYSGAPTAIETIVVAQRPFDTSKVINGEKITIKGDLAAKQRDIYHVRLTLTEWKSEKNNNRQSCGFDLTPGKVESFGFVSSIVYIRTILLTPLPKAKHRQ
jgi:hypothetical protein